MMMAAFTVYVTMREFFFRSRAHAGYLHIEVQGDTSQRVVPVQGYDTIFHADHGEDTHFAVL